MLGQPGLQAKGPPTLNNWRWSSFNEGLTQRWAERHHVSALSVVSSFRSHGELPWHDHLLSSVSLQCIASRLLQVLGGWESSYFSSRWFSGTARLFFLLLIPTPPRPMVMISHNKFLARKHWFHQYADPKAVGTPLDHWLKCTFLRSVFKSLFHCVYVCMHTCMYLRFHVSRVHAHTHMHCIIKTSCNEIWRLKLFV